MRALNETLTARGRVIVMHAAQATPKRKPIWKRRAADFLCGIAVGISGILGLIALFS